MDINLRHNARLEQLDFQEICAGGMGVSGHAPGYVPAGLSESRML